MYCFVQLHEVGDAISILNIQKSIVGEAKQHSPGHIHSQMCMEPKLQEARPAFPLYKP